MTILFADLERSELLNSLDAQPDAGSLCLETHVKFNPGCELIVDVSIADTGVRVLLSGYVSRVLPHPDGGTFPWRVVVKFFEREAHKTAYLKKVALGEQPAAEQRTARRLPVKLNVRWRPHKTGTWLPGTIEDISAGGAFVRTDNPISVGKKALFDVEVQGLESTVQIAGKIVRSQQMDERQGMGVQFVWRDRGGLVRLREILRRIEKPLTDAPVGGIGAPNSDFDEEVHTLVIRPETDAS